MLLSSLNRIELRTAQLNIQWHTNNFRSHGGQNTGDLRNNPILFCMYKLFHKVEYDCGEHKGNKSFKQEHIVWHIFEMRIYGNWNCGSSSRAEWIRCAAWVQRSITEHYQACTLESDLVIHKSKQSQWKEEFGFLSGMSKYLLPICFLNYILVIWSLYWMTHNSFFFSKKKNHGIYKQEYD